MNLSYWLGYSFFKLSARAFFNYRVIGGENLHVPGGALIVSNHASFLDPPFIGVAFDEDIHYFARKSLFKNPSLGALIRSWNAFPVDQDRPDMGSLRTVIRLLKSDRKVLVFPEGSRCYDGQLLPGLPGAGLIVAKSGVPVLPVRIFGTHEALPRGGKTLNPSEITVVCGKPWHYDPAKYSCEGKELYQRISDELMEQIAALSL